MASRAESGNSRTNVQTKGDYRLEASGTNAHGFRVHAPVRVEAAYSGGVGICGRPAAVDGGAAPSRLARPPEPAVTQPAFPGWGRSETGLLGASDSPRRPSDR
jgi:hypothetical protein